MIRCVPFVFPCATIYHCLGIDPGMPVHDHGRRPVPVAHKGQPLNDILV
jgi:hypothetical protein